MGRQGGERLEVFSGTEERDVTAEEGGEGLKVEENEPVEPGDVDWGSHCLGSGEDAKVCLTQDCFRSWSNHAASLASFYIIVCQDRPR